MNEKLNENIENTKKVLSTLPKDTKKNVVLYQEEIKKVINEYTDLKNKIEEEKSNRFAEYDKYSVNPKLDEYDKYINIYTNNLYLLSNSSSSYEKSGLDKLLFDLSKYYKDNLTSVNENILEVIKIFSEVGINITSKDFVISHFACKYMDVFLSHLNNIDNAIIKETFGQIYWKCSDLIIHIIVNFKYLYLKNKKAFDNYYLVRKMKFLNGSSSENVYQNYCKLQRDYDSLKEQDPYLIINKFKQRELVTSDFKDDKIDNFYKEIPIEELTTFIASIKEYRLYIQISYIIDAVKKMYEERASYKNLSKNILKNLKKEEGKLFKNNKKIVCLLNKGKETSGLEATNEGIIKGLANSYDELFNAFYKERFALQINEDDSYYNCIEFVGAHYIELIKIIKENNQDISKEEIDVIIGKVKELLFNPYLTLINNVTITNEKDIKIIISNRYSLSNFNVTPETFESDSDVEALSITLYKALIYRYLQANNIKPENIKFVCDCIDMNNKA